MFVNRVTVENIPKDVKAFKKHLVKNSKQFRSKKEAEKRYSSESSIHFSRKPHIIFKIKISILAGGGNQNY